jgi:hypothetical protein
MLHDLKWNARFAEKALVAVAQDVERDRRLNLGIEAGLARHWVLVRRAPPGGDASMPE